MPAPNSFSRASRRGRSRATGRQQQRGIAAIFAAISLVSLLSALALGIDVGRLYYAQRDLQRLADLAAIDAAKVTSGCLAGVSDYRLASAEVQNSLARNGKPSDVQVQVATGRRGSDQGLYVFQPSTAGLADNSVQVRLTRPSPARILPLFSGEDSRQLGAQAAATADWQASLSPDIRATAAASPEFANRFLGQPLGIDLPLTGEAYRAVGDASFLVGGLLDGSSTGGISPEELFEETPLPGLLTRIAQLLADTGNAAAANAVTAYSSAAQAGSGALAVVPAELFGLPTGAARDTYENASVNVGQLLVSASNAIANGGEIAVGVNDLLPPAICALVTGLCDISTSVSTGIPGRQGTFTPGSSSIELNSDDSISAGAGLLSVRVRVLEPVTGLPMQLPPLLVKFDEPSVNGVDMDCARVGQDDHLVTAEARANTFTLALGASQDYRPDQALALVPSEVLGVTVQQLLASAGIPVPPLLGLDVLGQTVRITASAGPVTIGSNASSRLCFKGPPWESTTQCDGSPATTGGVAPEQFGAALGDLIGNVQIGVEGLPGGAAGALVNQALQPVLASVNSRLASVLNGLTGQVIPMLQGVNVSGTGMTVRINSASVRQPVVYAR